MTRKTHLDQLNAEVTEAIFVAERLDNPVYLKSLGPLYPAHLQLRIQAWERVRKAEEALINPCFEAGLTPERDVALSGLAMAEGAIMVLRKEAAYLGADYYACDDPEELQHESPEEAIRDYLDNLVGDSWRETIAEAAPVEVTAYTRKEVPDEQIRQWTLGMVEDLEERVGDEYGGPEGFDFEPKAKEALFVEIMAAARKSINATHIWQCDQVGTREYSEEELLEMFKEDIEEEEAEGGEAK
jgi:hypothetical protein